MLRRRAIATLFAAGHWARAALTLAPYFEGAHGTAAVIDAATGRAIAEHGPASSGPPGSTLKPFVLELLVRNGYVRPGEQWACQGDLRIGGRSLTCSHPPMATPMELRTALAYSCNCFVAHFAERFREGQLAMELSKYGFQGAPRPEDVRLQALGVDGLLVSPNVLAQAYRRLARGARTQVVEGMADAVEYGTARGARVAGWKVAGKTGSAVAADGTRLAWFAGFAPSHAPAVVVAVMLQGRSGGADAAPVAGRILEACRKGTL